MSNQTSEVKIEDKRKFGFYMVDNVIVLKYGADIGPYGLAIYNVLCLHASRDGKSHPSYDTLAQLTGMSKRQAMREIEKLVKFKLIAKTTSNDGKTNTYQILDVKPSDTQSQQMQPVTGSHPASDTVSPDSDIQSSPIVTGSHPNNTHKNNTQEQNPREQKESSASAERPLTPQQLVFGKVCQIIGWDHKTLDGKSKVRVAQAVKIMLSAGYMLEDFEHFWTDVWALDWRWTEKHSRPTLNQLRQEIGKVRNPNGHHNHHEQSETTEPTKPRFANWQEAQNWRSQVFCPTNNGPY